MRLLLVHAHPDDETLTTGLAMAHAVAGGHEVHVLTCTLGEEGEVIPPELAHLAADQRDELGQWRAGELQAAMDVLGVAFTVLGEDREEGVLSRYRDSGMAGTTSAAHPRAFVRASLEEAAELVAGQIERTAPDVVVTYDAQGGYGHPDHIQTHRVTMAALARTAARERPAAYVVLTPLGWAGGDRAWLADHVDPRPHPDLGMLHVPSPDEPFAVSVVPDATVTYACVDRSDGMLLRSRQAAALACHRTQVSVFDGYYALSNSVAARLGGREGFTPIDPLTGRLGGGPARSPADGLWERR